MDPNACVARIEAAYLNEDWEEAIEAIEDLTEWLCKGGFAPLPHNVALIASLIEKRREHAKTRN